MYFFFSPQVFFKEGQGLYYKIRNGLDENSFRHILRKHLRKKTRL